MKWFLLAVVAVIVIGVVGWYGTHPKHCYVTHSDIWGDRQVCKR